MIDWQAHLLGQVQGGWQRWGETIATSIFHSYTWIHTRGFGCSSRASRSPCFILKVPSWPYTLLQRAPDITLSKMNNCITPGRAGLFCIMRMEGRRVVGEGNEGITQSIQLRDIFSDDINAVAELGWKLIPLIMWVHHAVNGAVLFTNQLMIYFVMKCMCAFHPWWQPIWIDRRTDR